MNDVDHDTADPESALFDSELADIAARRSADAGRTGDPVRFGDPEVVGRWPCRMCGKPAEVTQTAVDTWSGFNKRLRAMGQAPLDSSQIMVCGGCTPIITEKRTDFASRVTAKLRQSFMLLRDGGGTQEEERAAEDYLRRHDNFGKESIAAAHALRNKKRGGGKADW